MATASWPDSLKVFVNQTFARCTESNRPKVEEELKQRIFEAYTNQTLFSEDWSKVKLKSLDGLGVNATGVKPSAPASTLPSSPTPAPVNGKRKFVPQEDQTLRDRRKRRFESENTNSLASRIGKKSGSITPEVKEADPNVLDWDQHTIVGTSTKLEKPYLRLTTVPDPSTIRPLSVLESAFKMVAQRWKTDQNYGWVCDQLKSIRQDLTVQRIKNAFTIQVYEVHGRIALEKADLGEYNQCQSALRELYEYNLGGHTAEFTAYRILYLIYSRNQSELTSLISSLSLEQRSQPEISHAIQVRQALNLSNYVKLFNLYQTAPAMGAFIMDHFIPRERCKALIIMCKSYMMLDHQYLAKILGFGEGNIGELQEWLQEKQCDDEVEGKMGFLDCRKAGRKLEEIYRKEFRKVDIKGQLSG